MRTALGGLLLSASVFAAEGGEGAWGRIAPLFSPPTAYADRFDPYVSPLRFYDGRPVTAARDWPLRRQEILARWHGLMEAWPPLLAAPRIEIIATTHRENFTQHQARVEIATDYFTAGYLLVPDGGGPFPAAFVPYYDPETSVGLKGQLRDFSHLRLLP